VYGKRAGFFATERVRQEVAVGFPVGIHHGKQYERTIVIAGLNAAFAWLAPDARNDIFAYGRKTIKVVEVFHSD
jgi:hypothetical protein